MVPDRASNPGPLTYDSAALPIALRGPAYFGWSMQVEIHDELLWSRRLFQPLKLL